MNDKYRCNEFVLNKKNKRFKQCNKCYYRLLNNKKYCWTHYNKLCKQKVIYIQTIYRGYRCRQKITNIFIKLPTDLQHKIIDYSRTDIYYNKYVKLIYNLIRKRYLNYYKIGLNNNIHILSDLEIMDILPIIYDVYYLYNKYFDIIKYNFINNLIKYEMYYLNINTHLLKNKINSMLMYYFYEINNPNQNFYICLFNKLNNLSIILTEFSNKYNNTFL